MKTYRNDRFAEMKTTKVKPTFYELISINIHAFSIYLFCLIIFMKGIESTEQSTEHGTWSMESSKSMN